MSKKNFDAFLDGEKPAKKAKVLTAEEQAIQDQIEALKKEKRKLAKPADSKIVKFKAYVEEQISSKLEAKEADSNLAKLILIKDYIATEEAKEAGLKGLFKLKKNKTFGSLVVDFEAKAE